MRELRGRPVSPGFARGRALVHEPIKLAAPHYRIASEATGEERRRLEAALRHGAEDLAHLREHVKAELGEAEAEIFDAHLALLSDREFSGRIADYIERERVNAEWAVEATVGELVAALASADSAYLRERAADIRDLGRRVLRHLVRHGRTPFASLPASSILVARELYPLELLEIDRANLAGIVTEQGGETGHAAILARALAIPAITGIPDAPRLVAPGAELLVDGICGTVWVDPAVEEAERFSGRACNYMQGLAAAIAEEGLPGRTLDGIAIGFYANIGRAHEAEAVGRHGLDGVGLFRTEYLFLDETEAPAFDKHRAVYRSVAEQLGERPLVIRTLDLGGDKFPRFLAPHHEANPTLGLRGLRFSLTSGRALFETQVRAILAVAARHREVRILLPMVLGPGDFSAALAIIENLARRERLPERPKVGVMIETPAAVLTIGEILELADFASLGTNDLTQFMLAADRNALEVIEDHTVLHPAVLRAIRLVAEAGAKAGKPVGVCGEAAADPAIAALLIGLGIRELSMSPAASPRVRQRVRGLDSRDAEALAKAALNCQGADAVRMAVYSWPRSPATPHASQGLDSGAGASDLLE
jgi:phosphoenolpyruvate-protein phosphotransferase